MKHGPIDRMSLLMTLISLIFISSGATRCVSPKSFVEVPRAIFPRSATSNTATWESEVCSISGRVRGAVFPCFAIFILYQVWSATFRQITRLLPASVPTESKSTLLRIGLRGHVTPEWELHGNLKLPRGNYRKTGD